MMGIDVNAKRPEWVLNEEVVTEMIGKESA